LFSFFLFLLLFFLPSGAFADHEGPERIVEGKYVVILTLVPEGKAMRLKFFFRDALGGKSLTQQIFLGLKIADEKNTKILIEEKNIEVKNGVGEFVYQFSRDGLYNVFMEFEKADEPGYIYRSAPWSIWAPGAEAGKGRSYPIGASELAGFGLAALLALIVFINLWGRKRKMI